jgi:hypothetical protein
MVQEEKNPGRNILVGPLGRAVIRNGHSVGTGRDYRKGNLGNMGDSDKTHDDLLLLLVVVKS